MSYAQHPDAITFEPDSIAVNVNADNFHKPGNNKSNTVKSGSGTLFVRNNRYSTPYTEYSVKVFLGIFLMLLFFIDARMIALNMDDCKMMVMRCGMSPALNNPFFVMATISGVISVYSWFDASTSLSTAVICVASLDDTLLMVIIDSTRVTTRGIFVKSICEFIYIFVCEKYNCGYARCTNNRHT